ncbi:unnamed protein product [Camellia sinensis]
MVDFARVQKELQECNKDNDVSGISIKPEGDHLTHLAGTIPGPLATPYEGGTFNIDIILPEMGTLLNLHECNLLQKFGNTQQVFYKGQTHHKNKGTSLTFKE